MSTDADAYNKDELVAPVWLNEDFIAKVLRECEKNSAIMVQNLEITPASKKGDHYASIMFRVEVEYLEDNRAKTKSLILKAMPESEGQKRDILKESHIFETEIGMYTDILPKFQQILRNVGDNTVFGPRCLYSSLSPRKLIIFEDLCLSGYVVLRKRQVNLEEAKLIYLKLAKMQAVSYKLAKEQSELFEKYRHGSLEASHIADHQFIKMGIENFIELLNTEPTLIKYKPHFVALKENLIRNVIKSFREYRSNPQPNGLYVLVHGDFHFKNIMFKNNTESGKLEDVMMLDFQFSFMGPMIIDLIYGFFMMVDTDMREKHYDELLHFYLTNFVDTLKKIGYNGVVPTMFDLLQQWMAHKDWELFLFVSFMPMVTTLVDEITDFEEYISTTDIQMTAYRNKKYINALHKLLPKYLNLGYLEN